MKEHRPALGDEVQPEASAGSTGASVSSSAFSSLPSQFDVPDASSVGLWNFDFTLPVSLKRLQCIDFDTSSEEVVFAEIFAGSGNLSESVRDAGLAVHAIDSVSKRQSGVSIHVLDLTKENDISILLDVACHGAIVSAHFAPPCGTSSKARERPLPPELEHVVSNPLRSSDEPLGISGLTGLDSIRVAAANKLYAFGSHHTYLEGILHQH